MSGLAPDCIAVMWRERFEAWEHVNKRLMEGSPDAKLYREWWGRSSELLLFWVRIHEQQGIILEPAPIHLMARLGVQASNLSNGYVSELFRLVASGSGRRKAHASEARDIEAGIVYLVFVEDGLIGDPHPVKTVSEAFQVTRQAVQNWSKEKARVRRKYRLQRMSPESVREKMIAAGEQYRRLGRSASAVRTRDGKRRSEPSGG